MRHRIKSGKTGSFNPENIKAESEGLESENISEEVEEIFEEDTELRGDDEALEAMEYYDKPDENE